MINVMRPRPYLVTRPLIYETPTSSYQQHHERDNELPRDVLVFSTAITRLQSAEMSGLSPSSSGLLPMPGAPSSSWAGYKARVAALLGHHDTKVIVAFWLFGMLYRGS